MYRNQHEQALIMLFDPRFNTQLSTRWAIPTIIEELKEKAKKAGLWNLFLPSRADSIGLSNLDYAPLWSYSIAQFS